MNTFIRTAIQICWLLTIPLTVLAASGDGGKIPPGLEEWKSWTLYGQEQKRCPVYYNDGNAYQCAWPSEFILKAGPGEGRFEQNWLIFSPTWIPLPGEPGVQPESVIADGIIAPVISRNGVPCIYLNSGKHVVEGTFAWDTIPEVIRIPPSSGLIRLYIGGKAVNRPILDKNGRLWLQKRSDPETKEDRREIKIYRLIDDSIPMRVTTHVDMTISGGAREIRLDHVIPDQTEPIRLESSLPARLSRDGELMIQARPGRWTARIESYYKEPMYSIGPAPCEYGREIWSFKARSSFRVVEIEGAPSVEPSRTQLPREWRRHPAYIITPDTTLKIKELRRGDPDPAPDRLALERTFWLDFDGDGFTIRDHITGSVSRNWYLAMNPPARLGRVTVDGENRLITYPAGDEKPGVELRRGMIDLKADSRYEKSIESVPAVGWDHDFQSLSATLNLPPGWRLFTASGVDIAPGTWFQRWTLLDLFIVLIIAISVYKLRNAAWGLITLAAMILIYHEIDAPRLVFLHILAALALMKVIPEGRIRRIIKFWALCSIIVLATISVTFMVQQARWGIYPQLEPAGHYYRTSLLPTMGCGMAPNVQMKAGALDYEADQMPKSYSRKLGAPQAVQESEKRETLFEHDPDALIQTGPGLPTWRWRTMSMKWNGPVESDQKIRLWLLSPSINMILAFSRIILLALMIYGLIDRRNISASFSGVRNASIVAAIVIFGVLAGHHTALASEVPPPEILNQMRDRLLAPPDCLPYCADMNRMTFEINPDTLNVHMKIHTAVETAVPFPGSLDAWTPQTVLIDNRPAEGLMRDNQGILWGLVPEGIHTVIMSGAAGSENVIRVSVPLKPRMAEVRAEGWEVTGVSPEGTVESGVQFIRQQQAGRDFEENGVTEFAPFFHVKRVLRLGLTWGVETTVERLTTDAVPASVSVPLLKGESVTSENIRVHEHAAQINMDAGVRKISWGGVMRIDPEIVLTAPENKPWTETWTLDASPIWHCEFSGVTVIHHQDESGLRRPEWRPWPGETVHIRISKPKPAPGRILTIDSADLEWTPGLRFNRGVLNAVFRTTQGQSHTITLDPSARVQVLKINGKRKPIRGEGGAVSISLAPGSSNVLLEWNQPSRFSFLIRAPHVDIGEKAANVDITFHMPGNRWIIWTHGPVLGPAVLFWSYLAVILLAAFALGKVRLTPLKFHHWLLLSLGLTQVYPVVALIVVGWFLVLAWRKGQREADRGFFAFNFTQLLIAAWTVAAALALYQAIENGLLGVPYMQISGNGSSDFTLRWFQDRIDGSMPAPWAFVLPMLVYRILMLLWALWLAVSLLKWIRWAWECFSSGGVWKKWKRKKKQTSPPPLPDDKTEDAGDEKT